MLISDELPYRQGSADFLAKVIRYSTSITMTVPSYKKMPPTRFRNGDRPHVALIVETSLISGREILRGIAKYAKENGPWSIYYEPRSLEAAVPKWLKRWKGDGLIARIQNERIAEAVLNTGLPAVDVLGVVENTSIPLVHVDNQKLGAEAAKHLIERGFREFGWCGLRDMNWSQARKKAFINVLKQNGFSCRSYEFPSRSRSDTSWEKQQERLSAWITKLPKPAGILACYDPVGQRVLEASRRAEIEVPDEVAVLGIDNDMAICDVCDPPLSSIDACHAGVGYQAAELLDSLLGGEKKPVKPIYIEPLGVYVRQSTDSIAIDDTEVASALGYIRKNAFDGISVQDVVDHVMVSRSSLKERFRRVLNRSIHEEIVETQIKRAKQLLVNTEFTIRQIATKCGFKHQEYFGAVFRAKVGKTPGHFRRDARK